jgi:hypothetical protein
MSEIQIKHRHTDAVLFECDAPDGLDSGLHMWHALEKAVEAGANLDGANLDGANLARANLDGAYLDGANLDGANLDGANLAGANLARANLAGAYLDGACLAGANLAGANLARACLAGANLARAKLRDGASLVGSRPIIQIGPIGSRSGYLVAYLTDQGLRLDAGCQRQITRAVFEQRLQDTHGENEHAQEYRAALAFIDAHAAIWLPKG